jgi:hypothetical protein
MQPQSATRSVYAHRSLLKTIGIFIAVLLFVGFVVALQHLVIWKSTCPAVNGRECNNKGTCDSGYCICTNVLFSGRDCSETLIPGYNRLDDSVCSNNRGIASPEMEYEDVFIECKYTPPLTINNRQMKGGWQSPACIAKINAIHLRIQNQLYDPYELAGTPLCIPIGDFARTGIAIDEIACPRNFENVICSNNGNTTVGPMNNFTTRGNGCQCAQPIYLLKEIARFSIDYRQKINTQYIAAFNRGFCGCKVYHPVKRNKVFILPCRTSHVCYCDETSSGEYCEEFVCRVTNGMVCSGNGDTGIGQGVEINTTRSLSSIQFGDINTCHVRCKEDTPYRCGLLDTRANQCVSDIRLCHIQDKNVFKKWRCPSGRLVEDAIGDTCAAGYTMGYLNDVNQARQFTCNPIVANDELENIHLKRCSGDESEMYAEGFYPSGAIYFNTPLIWYSFELNGSLSITYHEQTRIFTGINFTRIYGTFNESFLQVAKRLFDSDTSTRVQLINDNLNNWILYPAPFLLIQDDIQSGYEFLRIHQQQTNYIVLETIASIPYETSTSLTIGVYIDDTLLLFAGGGSGDLQACQANMQVCLWNRNTYLSLDGTRKICGNGFQISSSSDLSCSTPTNLQIINITTALIVKNRLNSNIDLTGTWTMELLAKDEISMLTITSLNLDTRIRNVEWVLVENVTSPCVCPALNEKNASEYNLEWMASAVKRRLPVNGEYALGNVSIYGDLLLFRGTYIGNDFMYVNGLGNVQTNGIIHINSTEYNLGINYCNQNVHPIICPTGDCAKLNTIDINTISSCECNTNTCTCSDDYFSKYSCTCSLTGCSCDYKDVEDELFIKYLSVLNQRCILARSRSDLSFTTSEFRKNNSNIWIVNSINNTYATMLLEIQIMFFSNNTCSSSVFMKARASIFSDLYDTIPITNNCSILIPAYNADVTYDEFVLIFMNDTDIQSITAFWGPDGIPIMPINVFASSNQQQAIHVLQNSHTIWSSIDNDDSHSYIQLNFNTLSRLTHIYVDFYTVGFPTNEGDYMDVEIYIQISQDVHLDHESDWITVFTYASAVFNNTDKQIFRFGQPILASHVRILSRFLLGIRMFIPMTDQTCENVTLLVNDDFTIIPSIVDYLVDRQNKLNASLPCYCEDSCILNGVLVTKDNICNEARFVIGEKSEITSTQYRDPIIDYFNIFNKTAFIQVNEFTFIWYVVNTSINLTNYVNATTGYQVIGNNSVYVKNFTFPYSWRVINNGTVETNITDFDYIGNNYCEDFTDCSDCGPSNGPKGFACELTEEQQLVLQDIQNRTDFITRETKRIQDFNLPFTYKVELTRRIIYLARDTCTDCNGLFQCMDGACSTTLKCPNIRYDCEGNGCTRPYVNSKKSNCACKEGYGGSDCSVGETIDGNPEDDEAVPVYLWHIAGSAPPLRLLQAGSLPRQKGILNNDIERWNFRFSNRKSFSGFDRISAEFSNFGIIVPRTITEGGKTYITTCPPLKEDPFGIQRLPFELIASRRVDGSIERFTNFSTWDNKQISYPITSLFTYDEFKYRCPICGQCVKKLSDCTLICALKPLCNGKDNIAKPDGSCACGFGKQTFIYTKEFTKKYGKAINEYDGKINPTEWNTENLNWRDWSHLWCKAKNCSEVDCSPPKGCFPGTKELNFKDKQYICGPDTSYSGKCALDKQACNRGEDIKEPTVCSDKGVAVRLDYHPEEWICKCGDPISRLANLNDIEVTQLVPNGFGGEHCGQYYCDEYLIIPIHYSKFDINKREPYRDYLGNFLPGVWKGGCGAPIGPNPDDLSLWLSKDCCPESSYPRLEQCPKVLCRIGNIDTCILSEECTGPERTPQVFVCNNKGKARMDGTCECDGSGTGAVYLPDYNRFSYDACFQYKECTRSPINQEICNQVKRCDFKHPDFLFGVFPYIDQQMWTFMARSSESISNRTFVMKATKNIEDLERIKIQAYTRLGLQVENDVQQLQSCRCVYPNENSTTPCCQLPYDTNSIFYGKSINTPYLIPIYNASNALIDGRIVDTDNEYLIQQIDFIQLRNTIKINLPDKYTISAIRLYARYSGINSIQIQFLSDSLQEICGSQFTLIQSDFRWWGTSGRYLCLAQYENYPFRVFYQSDYTKNCGTGEQTINCMNWMDSICPVIKRDPLNTFEIYRGCTSRCCIQLSNPSISTRSITIGISNNASLDIGEIQFFGSKSVVLDIPPILQDQIIELYGTNTTCRDQRFFEDIIQIKNTDFFIMKNWSSNTFPIGNANESQENCEKAGGRLAHDFLIQNRANGEAFVMGSTCTQGECYVGAKNIDDPIIWNIDRSLENDCLQCGSWIGPDSGNDRLSLTDRTSLSDYYSEPTSNLTQKGRLWKTQRNMTNNPTIKSLPWIDFIISVYNEATRQANMVPSNDRIRYAPFVQYEEGLVNCVGTQIQCQGQLPTTTWRKRFYPAEVWTPVTQYSNIQKRVTGGWYINTCKEYVDEIIKFVPDVTYDLICQDSLLNSPFINVGFGITSKFNTNIQTITLPNDGYDMEFWSNPSTCIIGIYRGEYCDERYTTRFFYVTPADDYDALYKFITPSLLSGRSKYVRGISIQGPCALIGNYDRDSGSKTFWDNGFRVYTEETITNRDIFHRPYQCYGGQFDDDVEPGKVIQELFFMIIPRFYSQKIKITIRAPKQEQFINTDKYNIGIETQPHMASNVDVKVLKELSVIPDNELQILNNSFTSWSNSFSIEINFLLISQKMVCGRFRCRNNLFFPTGGANNIAKQMQFENIPVVFTNKLRDQANNVIYNPFVLYRPCLYTCEGGDARVHLFMFNSFNQLPFVTSSDMGCPIRHAPDCIKIRLARFFWNTTVFDTIEPFAFAEQITNMKQTSLFDTPGPVYTELYVNRSQIFLPLSSYLTTDRIYYVRETACLRTIDYRTRFTIDQCVKVVRNPANSLIKFSFQPTICETKLYALCVYDVNKYLIIPGMQCDVCGDSTRIGGAPQIGSTCFDRFPLANQTNNEDAWKIYQAVKSQSLPLLLKTNQIDWDAIAQFLLTYRTESVITHWDEFNNNIGLSTRPGFISPGALEDPITYIDLDLKSKYTVACDDVVDPITGLVRKYCAQSKQACTSNDTGAVFATNAYPTVFDPVLVRPEQQDVCGLIIKPNLYAKEDRFGMAFIDPNFSLVDTGSNARGIIRLRAQSVNAVWKNTGKNSHGYYFLNDFNAYTRFSCLSCQMQLVITTLSYAYDDQVQRVIVSPWLPPGKHLVTVNFTFVSNTTLYQAVEFTFRNLQLNEVIELDGLLITDKFTIDKCTKGLLIQRNWVEPAPRIEDGGPTHVCIENKVMQLKYGAKDVGACHCAGLSYGGSSCSTLAVDTVYGKKECGLSADFNSMAIAPDGTLQRVDEYGGFFYNKRPYCKCQNEGDILQLKRNAISGFSEEYLNLIAKDPLAEDYGQVGLPVDFSYPLSDVDVESVCASQSASLPSFQTVDELNEFLFVTNQFTFIDTIAIPGQLYWKDRAEIFYQCEGTDYCGQIIQNPCDLVNQFILCRMINYNNLLFNVTGSFYDGKSTDIPVTGPINILHKNLTGSAIDVFLISTDTSLEPDSFPFTLQVFPSGFYCVLINSKSPFQYSCPYNNIATLQFQRFPNNPTTIQEILAYSSVDLGRNIYYFK